MENIFSFKGTVTSDLSEVRPFLKNVLVGLRDHIPDEELMFDLRLILDELVINGVIHGNQENEEKCVSLNVTIENNAIIIKVKDEGCGIKYDFNSYDFRDLKCCGRGLLLVKALTDSLVLNKNEIIVVKNY
ncbi:ATP-binding protein [Anaerosphaera multitolerans]|uniref:ATP-binding protein n=1 Tax=Anaerosphaera multitolerans TaxID=2487351 RepID=A0A437S6L3_9FIRM|nr:ATP-binding protein [Anaerosphaera multitolerans]RVU54640.1 ATP-binding protein [Anaerosphaera multitolerans]